MAMTTTGFESRSSSTPVNGMSSRNPRQLEETLSAFAHRFPVSGRIVHAIAQEYGGVIGLAEHLEKNGLWSEAQLWMVTGKPVAMDPGTIRQLFSDDILQGIATSLAIPAESVEVQAALGIPKFFSTLGNDEDDDDLHLGYGAKPKKRNRARV